MGKIALHWKILIGLLLGIIWAIISSYIGISKFNIIWIKPFGDIFIRLLKLIAVPLVLFSIISGISNLSNVSKLGRLSLKTLIFYLMTTFISVTIGLTLVNTIQPGNRVNEDMKQVMIANLEKNLENSGDAKNIEDRKEAAEQMRKDGPLSFVVELFTPNIFQSLSDNVKMLQVIIFAILFGLGINLIPEEKGKPVKAFIDGINEIFLKLIDLVMQAAPFFVFALLAGILAQIAGDDPSMLINVFSGMGWFALTAFIGLMILIFLFYPLVMKIFVGHIPYTNFFKKIGSAQLLAFSTSSSAATLPVTMDCVHDNIGVSKDITSFVLPIGATVNMDGTSLYQAVTAIFLAQFFGADLSLMQQLTIVFTATLASIGTPAVPSAGLVMLIIVLESVGLPAWWIALIFPIDRPLDMIRTVVNVTGDATAAAVIAKSEGEELLS